MEQAILNMILNKIVRELEQDHQKRMARIFRSNLLELGVATIEPAQEEPQPPLDFVRDSV